MCELNKYGDRRIDPCLNYLIRLLNKAPKIETVACCCGHGKYPLTIVIKGKTWDDKTKKFIDCFIEVISKSIIFRKKKFYKRDSEGYHYIPEAVIK